jgi:hypothetical protein
MDLKQRSMIRDYVLHKQIENGDPGETQPRIWQGCSLSVDSQCVGCPLSERENIDGRRRATRETLR